MQHNQDATQIRQYVLYSGYATVKELKRAAMFFIVALLLVLDCDVNSKKLLFVDILIRFLLLCMVSYM